MPGPTYNASELLERGALPPDQGKVAAEADGMEKELHELKARFDQFFLGIDRKNPSREVEDLRGRLVGLKSAFIRNTALKFRIQSLYQRFLAYDRLWQRTLKEVEEGTYRRDILRLRHKNELKRLDARALKSPKGPAEAGESSEASFEILEDLGDLDVGPGNDALGTPPHPAAGAPGALARQPTGDPPVARQPTGTPAPLSRLPTGAGSTTPKQTAGAPPPAAGAQAGGNANPTAGLLPRQATAPPRAPGRATPQMSSGSIPASSREPRTSAPVGGGGPAGSPLGDQALRSIYDAYITARKRCRESTEGITFKVVAQSLRRQVPALLKQRGATSVEFRVVIKDGKAVLKAVPK